MQRAAAGSAQRLISESERNILQQELFGLISKSLRSDNIVDQEVGISMIQYAPTSKRANLIRLGLKSKYITIQKLATSMIELHFLGSEKECLQDLLTPIISDALKSDSLEDQKSAVEMIRCAPN